MHGCYFAYSRQGLIPESVDTLDNMAENLAQPFKYASTKTMYLSLSKICHSACRSDKDIAL